MDSERYNARVAEPKWQRIWEEREIFRTRNEDSRPKYYVLEMFPYPSGRIHMGHVRNYTMGDVIARYKRARGFNVLHPMGWDAFGMPAENAAWHNKSHPADWTYANIAAMRGQLKSMGLSLDWSREIATCDPAYYKHQQRMVLDFLDAGLVVRKKSRVNWDPLDRTVLANEQVIDGRGWRSGALVEQRELTQWFFKITDYAEDLLAALDELPRWPEKVRLMQANWIGRSEGLALRFELGPAPQVAVREVEVYTTRQDTLFGAKFLAVAADHPLAAEAARTDPELATFIALCHHGGTSLATLETAEKKGYDTGLKARHPFDPDWQLPVYVANFVLMDYGTGAIFGCPAHDQRDLEFANKYGLGNTPVVCPPGESPENFSITTTAYEGDGVLINSRFLNGMRTRAAKEEVARRLEAKSSSTGRRPDARSITGCAIGEYRASAIGAARSQSSIARPAAWCRFRQPICRSNCRRRCLSRSLAIRSTGIRAGSMSRVLNAARRRFAKLTPWILSSIPPGILQGSPIRGTRPRQRQPHGSKSGYPSINISAASSTRFCTCSMHGFSPARCGRRITLAR